MKFTNTIICFTSHICSEYTGEILFEKNSVYPIYFLEGQWTLSDAPNETIAEYFANYGCLQIDAQDYVIVDISGDKLTTRSNLPLIIY